MDTMAVEAPREARACRVPRTGHVVVNPVYRERLEQLGLVEPADFFALPAVVVSGHPDRNVARVTLGAGPAAISAFLKREHRPCWKFRLINAWEGFGVVSRTHREAVMLRAARHAGVGCPELIAAGEDPAGQSFLLVREFLGAVELRRFLSFLTVASERRALARTLGETLARLHAAGFDHPDLYSKHIFVNPADGAIRFLDWQRSRQLRRLTWRRRLRDLATLDASLAPELATARERLACLRAYLHSLQRAGGASPRSEEYIRTANLEIRNKIQTSNDQNRGLRSLGFGIWCFGFVSDLVRILDWACPPGAHAPGSPAIVVRAIRRRSSKLAARRRTRELWHAPVADGTQSLIRLDGEALCVTPVFHAALEGRMPDWLTCAIHTAGAHDGMTRNVLPVPRVGQAVLVRRRAGRFWQWLWSCVRTRPFTSPELDRAGLLFRLQRFGVATPRVWAFGQRFLLPWRTESFLLVEATPQSMSLPLWLASNAVGLGSFGCAQRWRVIRQTGLILRRLHESGCSLDHENGRDIGALLWVRLAPQVSVMLGGPEGVRKDRHLKTGHLRKDLAAMDELFLRSGCSRTEVLRFVLAYLDLPCLTAPAKRLMRRSFPFQGDGR